VAEVEKVVVPDIVRDPGLGVGLGGDAVRVLASELLAVELGVRERVKVNVCEVVQVPERLEDGETEPLGGVWEVVLDESERLRVLVCVADGDNEKERLKDWECVVDRCLLALSVLVGDKLMESVALPEQVRVGLGVGDLLMLLEADLDQEADELQDVDFGIVVDPEAVLLKVPVWLRVNEMVALCEGVEVGLFE